MWDLSEHIKSILPSIIPVEKHNVHFSCNQVLYSETGLSFWGGVSPKSGIVVDRHHPLCGQHLNGKILAIPAGRGRDIPLLENLYRDVWGRCLGKSMWAINKISHGKKWRGRSQWYDIYNLYTVPKIYQWRFTISDDSIHNSQSIWTLFALQVLSLVRCIYNDSRPMFHLAIVAVLLHDLLRKKKLVGFEFWHDGSDDRILHWEPSDLGIVIEWNVPSGHCLPSRWDHCAGCHRSGGTLWSKIASGLFGGAGWSDPFFFAKNYREKWMMSTTSKQSF